MSINPFALPEQTTEDVDLFGEDEDVVRVDRMCLSCQVVRRSRSNSGMPIQVPHYLKQEMML